VIPLICLGGAGMSAWRRKQRVTLVNNVTTSNAASALSDITWSEFEILVGEAFRLQGYKVIETGGGGPDGGVDLLLSKGSEKFLVQCKQWKAFKVGVDTVRQLYGVMAAQGATGGFVVTSGRFTAEAISFGAGRNIQLIDGDKLFAMIKAAKTSLKPDAGPSLKPVPSFPSCPACGAEMLRREAKRGANAGNVFWGCSKYPACKGIKAI
jgi:restriction system protein